MNKIVTACFLLLAIFLPFSRASAQATDHAAVLAMTQRIFEAVSSQDADEWRALQVADGTTLSFRSKSGGAEGEMSMSIARNEDFVAGITPGESEYVERWTAEPTVMIRGPIAVVWGEYDFWIDGDFSHCGVDSIDLVKIDGEWKLANIMWTVELKDCPTDPSM
jgi:hypothetical protein